MVRCPRGLSGAVLAKSKSARLGVVGILKMKEIDGLRRNRKYRESGAVLEAGLVQIAGPMAVVDRDGHGLGEGVREVEGRWDLNENKSAVVAELAEAEYAGIDVLGSVERADGARHVDGSLVVLIKSRGFVLGSTQVLEETAEILCFASGERCSVEFRFGRAKGDDGLSLACPTYGSVVAEKDVSGDGDTVVGVTGVVGVDHSGEYVAV